jgi:transposase
MSLKPFSDYVVPERTASVARAAFPKGNLCIRIFDELGTIFQDQDFADLYSQEGHPGQQPFHLALVTVLQFIEGLSDRGAADAVRGRIDWKYLLCLELDDPGFDHSVLCEFRTRLLEGGAERILFDKILSALRDKKLVKARTRQRTDSTHVLAAVRDLNRLERVGQTLHATLNVLAVAAPEWVSVNVPTEWVDRYGKRVDDTRQPAPSSSSAHAVPRGWRLATRRPTRSRSSNGPLSRSLLLRRRGAMGQCHPARASGAAVCEQRFRERQTSWRSLVLRRRLVLRHQQFVF